jgi:hypothetical protein
VYPISDERNPPLRDDGVGALSLLTNGLGLGFQADGVVGEKVDFVGEAKSKSFPELRIESLDLREKSVSRQRKSSRSLLSGESLHQRSKLIPPNQLRLTMSRRRSLRRSNPTPKPAILPQRRKAPPESNTDEPTAIHGLRIPAHPEQNKDYKPARDVDPSIVKHGAVVQHYVLPRLGVVDLVPAEVSAQLLVGQVGDQDVDLHGDQADGEDDGYGE